VALRVNMNQKYSVQVVEGELDEDEEEINHSHENVLFDSSKIDINSGNFFFFCYLR